MTPQEIVDRAERAKEVLDNPTLQKAFEGVRGALVINLEEVALGDIETQHEIAVSLQLLKQLKRQLHNWVNDGTLEKEKAKVESSRRR